MSTWCDMTYMMGGSDTMEGEEGEDGSMSRKGRGVVVVGHGLQEENITNMLQKLFVPV